MKSSDYKEHREREAVLKRFLGPHSPDYIIEAYSGLDLEVPCKDGALVAPFIVYDTGHYTVLSGKGYSLLDKVSFIDEAVSEWAWKAKFRRSSYHAAGGDDAE